MKKKDAIRVKHNKLALLESRVANQQKRIRDLETQLELQARMFDLYLIQVIRKYGEDDMIEVEVPKLALEKYKLRIASKDEIIRIAVEGKNEVRADLF